MSDRTFGVEIECNIPSVIVSDGEDNWGYPTRNYRAIFENLREAFLAAGLNAVDDYYDADTRDDWETPPNYWYLSTDSSLGANGFEIKTPALSGEDGFEELQKGFNVIFGTLEGNVDQRCGMHVHHGASDYARNRAAAIRLLETWVANRNHIHTLVDPSRRDNGYCRSINERDVYSVQMHGTSAFGRKEVYLGNLDNPRQTIEIRLHEGTSEFEIAESWVRFTQKMLDDVMKRVHPVPSLEDPVQLMQRFRVRRSTMRTLARKANIVTI